MMKLPLLSFLIVIGVGNAQDCFCNYRRKSYEGSLERLPGKLTAEPSVLPPDQLETLNEIRQGLGKSVLECYHRLQLTKCSQADEIAYSLFEWDYVGLIDPAHFLNRDDVTEEVQRLYHGFLNPDLITLGDEALDQKAVKHPEVKDALMKLKEDLRGLRNKLEPFCPAHLDFSCISSEEDDDEEEGDNNDDGIKECKN